MRFSLDLFDAEAEDSWASVDLGAAALATPRAGPWREVPEIGAGRLERIAVPKKLWLQPSYPKENA